MKHAAHFAFAADPVTTETLGRQGDQVFFAQAGIWPIDLRRILATAFETPLNRVDIARQESGLYEISLEGDGFSDSYEIDFRLRRLNHGTLVSTRNDRKTGRRAFAWRCIAARLMDLEGVSIYASMRLGGYIWAKAGVRTNDLPAIRLACQQRLEEIAPQLGAQDRVQVENLLRFANPADLQNLACLSQPIDHAARYFDRVTMKPFYFQSYCEAGLFRADTITLGQFLLAGQKYHAYVDLRDDAHLAQVGAYCGVDIAAIADGIQHGMRHAAYPQIPAAQTARPL